MGVLMEELEGLSEDDAVKVSEFVRFLKNKKQKKDEQTEGNNKPKRVLGTMRGKLKYMADDFDETPDCFKEYM